jgi:hypothetical protein
MAVDRAPDLSMERPASPPGLLPTPQYMEVIKGAAIKRQFPASYRDLLARIETRVFDQ